eukprot:symbB.v1.2.017573.t1/scaffold1369.1/size123032/6
MGRDDPGAPSFRTKSLINEDRPQWNETSRMLIEQGESLIFMVNYKDDDSEDDLIGWAKLEYSAMMPNGFVGELSLSDAAASQVVDNVIFRRQPFAGHAMVDPADSLEKLLASAKARHHRCLLAALHVEPACRWQLCQRVVFFDLPQASAETLWAACETVSGGGIVCLVLPPQLTLDDCISMQKEAQSVIAESEQKLGEALLPRLVQSLWKPCSFVDQELKILATQAGELLISNNAAPAAKSTFVGGEALLQLCCTPCQEKALQAILEAIGTNISNCQRLLSLTGRRGRGKSTVAALGMVAALQRQRCVVVTGPGSNSVQGMFRFAAKVLDEAEISDGPLRSLMAGRARFLHAETVPGYVAALSAVGDAPVLIVDEMASLAIPTLHQLLSAQVPLVLLLGTLSGAEGTGAAIQEKVFKELGDSAEACHHATLPPGVSKREFVRLTLQEAVRYKPNDPVETWLDSLLFLDVPSPPTDPKAYGPLNAARFMELDMRQKTTPQSTLVSSVMGLLRGHYRTSPNDLARLVTDMHIRTFALVGNGGEGPPAVAVVAIEETPERLGKSSAKVHQTHLLANGVEKEYPHLALARLSGLRPWRVVAAPALRGRGFGQKALEQLELHVRSLADTSASFDWLGVSFGLTPQLFRFWSRAGYRPVVMSNTPNDQTGEMSIKMLLPVSAALERALPAITPLFGTSFYRRLATCFRELDPSLVVEILSSSPARSGSIWQASPLEASRLENLATARKPVEEVARNYDMFNCLASAYFFGFLEGLHFSKSEEAALCAVGAQMLSLEEAAERLGRGSKPGDRQNDVAARLRMEISLHIGAIDMECLLTIAPREQVLLERSHSHFVAQLWLPPLLELHSKEVWMPIPGPFDEVVQDNLAELANYAVHDLHLQEPHFSMLVSGVKRIELRLAKKRFTCIEAKSFFVCNEHHLHRWPCSKSNASVTMHRWRKR